MSFHINTLRLGTISSAALLAAALLSSSSPAFAQNDIIIGAREPGSNDYIVGVAAADAISKNSKLTGKVLTSAGAAVWMPMMDSKEADLGVISHYEAWLGRNGKGLFTKPHDVRVIVAGSGISVGLYVRKDSKYQSRKDIAGARIANEYSGSPALATFSLAEIANVGFDWKDMRASPRASLYAGQREDFTERRLDIFYASVGSGLTRELDSTIGIRFLGIDDSPAGLARIKKVYPALIKKVKPGAPGITKPMTLIYLSTYLVGRNSLSDEKVYQVVKSLWDGNKEFRAANKRLGGWTTDKFAVSTVTIPYHNGTIRFLREKGVWTEEMQANQDALLKK